jgi:hypothetical protein
MYNYRNGFCMCQFFFAKQLQSTAIFHCFSIEALSESYYDSPFKTMVKFISGFSVHQTTHVFVLCVQRCEDLFYLLFPVTEHHNEKQTECWAGCGMLDILTGHSAVVSCDFIGTKWLVHVVICIGGNLLIDSALLGDHARPVWNYRLIDSTTTELLAPSSVLTKPS